MAGDPADVRGAPKGVLLPKIEDVFCGDGYAEQVSAGGVENALRFSC